MATNFPGSLDSFTNPSSSSTLDSPSHAAQHANINDAMVAVQTKLGVGAGTIGEYTTFTTSATNITISSQDCIYAQVNEIVVAHYYVTFGGAASGEIGLSLPVAMSGYGEATRGGLFAPGLAADTNTGLTYILWPCRNLTVSDRLRFFAQGYGSAFGTVSTSTPFTWASSDTMRFSITYMAA